MAYEKDILNASVIIDGEAGQCGNKDGVFFKVTPVEPEQVKHLQTIDGHTIVLFCRDSRGILEVQVEESSPSIPTLLDIADSRTSVSITATNNAGTTITEPTAYLLEIGEMVSENSGATMRTFKFLLPGSPPA